MRRVTLGVLLTGLCVGLSAACGGGGSDGTSVASPPAAASTSPATSTASATPSSPSPTGPRPFTAKIDKVTRATVKHSWHPGCPVGIGDLRLLTMTYWGMDKKPHTGQMVVNADSATKIVKVFRTLYNERYPIRRMELVDKYGGSDFDSIEADNTSAFNCRRVTGGTGWSEHAYGTAIDIDPVQNPYVTTGGTVLPERGRPWADRDLRVPGMIHRKGIVRTTFLALGWGWGGDWSGTKDYQHVSLTGR